MNFDAVLDGLEIQGADPESITVVDRAGWAWRRNLRNGDADWRNVDSAWEQDKTDTMRILALTPAHPSYGIRPQTLESIHAAMRAYDGPIDWVLTNGDNERPYAYQNIVHHHNKARRMTLEGGYDAMLSIEADMIVPEDAVERLIATGADVAYGLYVWRHAREKKREEKRHKWHRWSAYRELTLWGGTSISLDWTGEEQRAAWGKVLDVAGLGMGCTLIRRNVLETVAFRLYEGNPDDWLIEEYMPDFKTMGLNPYESHPAMMCDDFLFALDAAHHGFTQRCDLGLVCGHIHDGAILWPDPDASGFYRSESV